MLGEILLTDEEVDLGLRADQYFTSGAIAYCLSLRDYEMCQDVRAFSSNVLLYDLSHCIKAST